MNTQRHFTICKGSYFLILGCILFGNPLFAQQTYQTDITDYVIFGGKKAAGQTPPLAPFYAVQMGSSCNTLPGSKGRGAIGSYGLVKSTGNLVIDGHIYSDSIIQLTNSNVVTGNLAAVNSHSAPGTIISVGSSAAIGGNIDANGNIIVGGGSVAGAVTHPLGTTYSGPVPGGGNITGPPTLPILPAMPPIISFPDTLPGSPNITTTQQITPDISGTGIFGNVILGGNKTLTFKGTGIYVLKSIKNTGTSNDFVFDFDNKPGTIKIYVWGNVDLGKVKASTKNDGGTGASRIYFEVHGKGIASNPVAFNIANGSAGQSSKWVGTVWAPYAAINFGSGTGSTNFTGALWSGTQVNLQSGISIIFEPFSFCDNPVTAKAGNAGLDTIRLDFSTLTRLIGSSTSSGVSFSWRATNGGLINSLSPNADTIYVSAAGTYILTVTSTSNTKCIARDTVVVTARLKSIIGSELQSIFDNKTSSSPFFAIQPDSVMIDVIVLKGNYAYVLNLLQTAPYGLRRIIPNGQSPFIITGKFPIVNLPKLNLLGAYINYCRPYYQAVNYTDFVIDGNGNQIPAPVTGLLTSAGDTTMRTYLVRKGYKINGDSIKIGVISDSYASISGSNPATPPFQPVNVCPNLPNPPQTFTTNDASLDVINDDLPGDTTFIIGGQPVHAINKNGFFKNVHIIKPLPPYDTVTVKGSDEGRAMLQIVHDIAPGAELYFRTGFNTASDFAFGIKQLRDAGCKVIVDDVTYITEAFLQDGIVARTVDTVKGQGVAYFSAAGNFANKSYEKDFASVPISTGVLATGPLAGKKAHNFGSDPTHPDIFQHVRFAPGSYTIVFQWADSIYSIGQNGTKNDLDIYLTPHTVKKLTPNIDSTVTSDSTALFGFNRDNIDGDPIEFIPFTIPSLTPGNPCPTDSVDANILIVNNTSATNPSRIKYIVFRGGVRIMEYNEGTSTLVGQANALGAIAVGAARFDKAPPYLKKPLIESYSSIGGTKTIGLTQPNGAIRNKTDVVGPDGVNTTVKLGQDYPNSALDGFSNFFGTSAGAPHAAGMAALIIQGRRKFLGQSTTNPDTMRSLMQSTAIDMGTPGFDFATGYGLINGDSAMRTFAAPTPTINQLVVLAPITSPPVIPGESVFTLLVKGVNYSSNSQISYDTIRTGTTIHDTIHLATTFISKDSVTALMPVFTGNPAIRVNTPPFSVSGLDGGYSNILHFFQGYVTVKAVDTTRKYGQLILPSILDTIITIDGKLLQDTTLTLADLGLTTMTLTTTATDTSNVGTYSITPARIFNIHNPADSVLLTKYHYTFIEGKLTIQRLPVTIIPNDQSLTYGQSPGPITFTYQIDAAIVAANPLVVDFIKASHETVLANNVIGLLGSLPVAIPNGGGLQVAISNGDSIKLTNGGTLPVALSNGQEIPIYNVQSVTGFNGSNIGYATVVPYVLTDAELANLSFFASNNSILTARTLTNNTHVIDVPQQSVLEYNEHPDSTTIFNTIAQVNARGILGAEPLANGSLCVAISNGGGLQVAISNGFSLVLPNGGTLPVAISNGGGTLPVALSNGGGLQVAISNSFDDQADRVAVIIDQTDVSNHNSLDIKSLNVVTGLTPGVQTIIPGTALNNNYDITYGLGRFTISDPCLLTRDPFNNFGSTTKKPTSLWLNVEAKVSGQLKKHGNYLLFNSGTVTFHDIMSDIPENTPVPLVNGKIIADSTVKDGPHTHYDANIKMWITRVPVGFTSTSDIFITGTIINSSVGFVKKKNNANSNTVVKGSFYSDATYADQWTYGIAAYQLPAPVYYFDYPAIAGEGQVIAINGTYRAGTPVPETPYLVNGASGGGGNNYTGSTSSYDNFTACCTGIGTGTVCPSGTSSLVSSLNREEVQPTPSAGEVQIIPNPARNYIMLSFVPAQTGSSEIVLFSIGGKKVLETNNGICEAGVQYQKKIDVSKLISGVYVVQLINKDKITIKKIIISR